MGGVVLKSPGLAGVAPLSLLSFARPPRRRACAGLAALAEWLGGRESNPDLHIQSVTRYHYATPDRRWFFVL